MVGLYSCPLSPSIFLPSLFPLQATWFEKTSVAMLRIQLTLASFCETCASVGTKYPMMLARRWILWPVCTHVVPLQTMKVGTKIKCLSLIPWLPVGCFLLVCWQKVGLRNTELTSGWIIMQPTLRRTEFASHFFSRKKTKCSSEILLKWNWKG